MKNIFKKYKNPKTNKVICAYELRELPKREQHDYGELDEDGFFIMSSYDMQHNTILGIQNDEIVSGFFSI